MKSFRAQLLLSHLLPLFIILPLLGLTVTALVESQILLVDVMTDLARTAQLVASSAATQPDVWQEAARAQIFAAQASRDVQREAILLNPDGAFSFPALVSQSEQLRSLSAADLSALQRGQFLTRGQYYLLLEEPTVDAFAPVFNADRAVVGIVRITDRLGEVYQGFQRLRGLIVILTALALLIAVVLALLAARRTERRVQEVTVAVQQVADGQTPALSVADAPREFRGALLAVENLAHRLQSSEETRKRLLANLVHELGRPLASLQAAIHALQQGAMQDATLRDDLLHGMNDQIERLKPLLDNLASLYKQTNGPVELQREPIELEQWLPSILVTWQAAAQAKSLQWEVDLSVVPPVFVDPHRLAQVVGNLVANAIQYTPAGGCVRVSTGALDQRVWLAVDDTGLGIAAEELPHLFEPFYRGARGSRFPQGMGLGLAISRDIVRAHDGEIEVFSAVGQGSRFIVYLPPAVADAT